MTARARAWSLVSALALTTASISILAVSPAGAAPTRTTFSQSQAVQLGDSEGFAEGEQLDVMVPDGQQADSYPGTAHFGVDATITHISVSIAGLETDHPDDLDILLVGPHGQQVTLMSDAGGANSLTGDFIQFDDDFTDPVPDDDAAGGFWRPADYEPGDTYPSPAPPSSGNTDLSVFVGTKAAGTWLLYVVDDTANGDDARFFTFFLGLETSASPYPSQVQVSGIGKLADVDVSFDRFSSSSPIDADFLLVGPQHQQATLMSDVGGQDDVQGADLRLDDEAAGPVPLQGLTAGSYRPADAENPADDDYSPGPPSNANTSLSVFDGTDPNGTWSLYAVDDQGSDYTRIEGWALHLEWDDPAAPSGSVTVADGAVATKSKEVPLAVSAADPAPASGVTRMRFSNDGATWSPYRPFATSTTWSLADGDGAKTVFAQFADAVGNVSATAQDTILLDTKRPRAKSVVPAKGAGDVPARSRIKITATEALDATTVNNRTVKLTRNGVRVPVKLLYKAAKHKIVVKPQSPLEAGTYQLKVKTRIRDLAGNRWDAKNKAGLQPTRSTFSV